MCAAPCGPSSSASSRSRPGASWPAFIRRNARLLIVSSDDFDYAYQIFLTINDRGKRLSVEDIFRGEILGPLDRDQRRRFEAIIDEIEKYREEAEPNRTKGKTFFSHLATIDGWPRRGIIEGLKKAVEKRGGPRRFVTEVFAPMAESYLLIKGAQGAAKPAAAVLSLLLGLRWLEQHGDDDWVPVAMVGLSRLSAEPERLVEFLRNLDRFAHGLMALGCGREARRRHYAPILKVIIDAAVMPRAAKAVRADCQQPEDDPPQHRDAPLSGGPSHRQARSGAGGSGADRTSARKLSHRYRARPAAIPSA